MASRSRKLVFIVGVLVTIGPVSANLAAERTGPSLQAIQPPSVAAPEAGASVPAIRSSSIGPRRVRKEDQATQFDRLLREAPSTLVIVVLKFRSLLSPQELVEFIRRHGILELHSSLVVPSSNDGRRVAFKLTNDGSNMATQIDRQFCLAQSISGWLPTPIVPGTTRAEPIELNRAQAESGRADVGDATLTAKQARVVLSAPEIEAGFFVAQYPSGSTEEITRLRIDALAKPITVPPHAAVSPECSMHVQPSQTFFPEDPRQWYPPSTPAR